MRPPLRLILGPACAAALSLFAACRQSPARADHATGKRADAAAQAHADAYASAKAATADGRAAFVPAEARWDDSDSDGIPDREELYTFGDRENFRKWFTSIAEQQFYEPSREWSEDQRDCAGLVRFAWREALRTHDRAWLLRMGESYEAVAPDVRAYTLEHGPVGEKLFRTSAGTFSESNLSDGTFSEFADARTLREFNSTFVSRDRREAQPGDLLFFQQPWVQKYPYHVMIYLGRAHVDSEGAADWVVYHTGSSPQDAGEVRKVRLAVLEHHPDPRWRPVVGNRNFLGFYRLKILQ